MAKKVETMLCGIDVSKGFLDIALGSSDDVQSVANTDEAISEWLSAQTQGLEIGLEATSTYHERVVEQALALGHRVYLINPRQLKHYRDAVGGRAKTDRVDALLLRRYLQRERSCLRPLSVKSREEKQLWQLLKRRGLIVKMRQQLRLSCEDLPSLSGELSSVVSALNRLIQVVDGELKRLARSLGWQEMMGRVASIPGIGPLNALSLTACYHRGDFRSVDAFIAFMGLDVRVRDSGRLKGKRKLTKQGEPEIRRLLYNAAMSFDRVSEYRGYRASLMSRGLSSTAAYVVIARKLARVAFTLIRKNRVFDETIFTVPCNVT